MRLLLSTIGTRGDVQPLVGLAPALRALGHEVRLCAPPDFRDWIEGLGLPVVAVGHELRPVTMRGPLGPPPLERLRARMEASVAAQFETIAQAAEGCDAILAASSLQMGAR